MWKVFVFGVFMVRIQSECGKLRTRKISKYGHFSRGERVNIINLWMVLISAIQKVEILSNGQGEHLSDSYNHVWWMLWLFTETGTFKTQSNIENGTIFTKSSIIDIWLGFLTRPLIYFYKIKNKAKTRQAYNNVLEATFQRCSYKKVFQNYAKLLYWNDTSAWVLSCKLAAYFQNTFSYEHLWVAASVSSKHHTMRSSRIIRCKRVVSKSSSENADASTHCHKQPTELFCKKLFLKILQYSYFGMGVLL